jgi:hypothetical protein
VGTELRSKLIAAAHALADAIEQQCTPPGEYSTAHLPPRTSRRAFNCWCREGKVHGARREGRGWVCTENAWREARARVRAPAKPKLRLVPPSDEELADVMIAEAGLRVTRRRR